MFHTYKIERGIDMKTMSRSLRSSPKPRIFLLSVKRNLLPALFCLFTACLVIFSKSNLSAAKTGLLLWANQVVPSLLPFFMATEMLSYTTIVSKIGKFLDPIMRPLFNVPGCGAYAFIMGIISGYPVGAKIVSNFRLQGLCTKEEAERLVAFTNNSGPLFILGTIGISFFGNTLIGILLLITHVLAGISVGILFRFWKRKQTNIKFSQTYSPIDTSKDMVSFSNLGEVLGKSILSAINSVMVIGGFVVLFSVVLSILDKSHLLQIGSSFLSPLLKAFGITDSRFSVSLLSGFLELTNGVKQVALIPYKCISVNIILAAFLLGFGGFSVLLQVFSITAKTDISIKAYFYGKVLHGLLAASYTFLMITYFPIFNLNL